MRNFGSLFLFISIWVVLLMSVASLFSRKPGRAAVAPEEEKPPASAAEEGAPEIAQTPVEPAKTT